MYLYLIPFIPDHPRLYKLLVYNTFTYNFIDSPIAHSQLMTSPKKILPFATASALIQLRQSTHNLDSGVKTQT